MSEVNVPYNSCSLMNVQGVKTVAGIITKDTCCHCGAARPAQMKKCRTKKRGTKKYAAKPVNVPDITPEKAWVCDNCYHHINKDIELFDVDLASNDSKSNDSTPGVDYLTLIDHEYATTFYFHDFPQELPHFGYCGNCAKKAQVKTKLVNAHCAYDKTRGASYYWYTYTDRETGAKTKLCKTCKWFIKSAGGKFSNLGEKLCNACDNDQCTGHVSGMKQLATRIDRATGELVIDRDDTREHYILSSEHIHPEDRIKLVTGA